MSDTPSKSILFGVCAGLSNKFGIDVTIVRIAFILATIFGIGFPILIYIILALIMPKN
jgi:phage shock protein PspC (stress-responsive transcriptional regulator)